MHTTYLLGACRSHKSMSEPLELACSLPIRQGKRASELQRPTWPHLPSLGLQDCTIVSDFFTWVLERKIRFFEPSSQPLILSYEIVWLMKWVCIWLYYKPELLNTLQGVLYLKIRCVLKHSLTSNSSKRRREALSWHHLSQIETSVLLIPRLWLILGKFSTKKGLSPLKLHGHITNAAGIHVS